MEKKEMMLTYKKKVVQKKSIVGLIYIKSTANNTIITVTDNEGNVLLGNSSGSLGFSGARRKTSFAAQAVGENIAKKCIELGISRVQVCVRGFGQGRESSLRGLFIGGLSILKIQDQTPLPHNGCRPPKKCRG